MRLRERVEALTLEVEALKKTLNDIMFGMKEHDDEYERLVTGMTNMMNYSYTTALEAEKHEN